MGVAYSIYPMEDIKHREVREHERHLVNDSAVFFVILLILYDFEQIKLRLTLTYCHFLMQVECMFDD